MKRLALLLVLWAFPVNMVTAQNARARIDSLRQQLTLTQQDTSRVLLLADLGYEYQFDLPDSTLKLGQQALLLGRKIKFTKGEGRALSVLSIIAWVRGELPQALDQMFKALTLARAVNDRVTEALMLHFIGAVYVDLGGNRKGLSYYQEARKINESLARKMAIARSLNGMTVAYMKLKLLDSARIANQQARRLAPQIASSIVKLITLTYTGRLAALVGNYPEAFRLYRDVLRMSYLNNDVRIRSVTQLNMAELFNQLHQPDSSLHYANLALTNSRQANFKAILLNASNLLTQLYKSMNKPDSALHYLEIARAANDSLYGPKKFQQLQVLTLSEQQRQQALIAAQNEYKNKIQLYSSLAGLVVILLVALILHRTNRQKQKANVVLVNTLSELKATQTQLIQREKMASLGELTAGIAHEIQNPLNFVNNFSELSTELMEELDEEADNENTHEIKHLSRAIRENLIKITHHGHRASNIVKGMLEHSRTSSGQKESTDLNALADEYLRLAYQGMRRSEVRMPGGLAKDIAFNATLINDFAPNLPSVNVVLQEIGRVLLNLYNNAFYAVQQKQQIAPPNYQPAVTVSTTQVDSNVVIRVKDNGTGIPDSVKAKIFQPFFTTKPTGEGTGLGLSLSYDIVTKGHSGTLDVTTEPGEFTEFSLILPIA